MKRIHILALMAVVAGAASAQSALDAHVIGQRDLRGTARFMSMAGAFGALGGDLSTLNQNPAGIGVYRSSEVGVTVDLSMLSAKTSPWSNLSSSFKENETKFYCNNFGYVGAIRLNSETVPYIQFGASYSRIASFNRVYSGDFPSINGSLSNYIADFTTAEGWPMGALNYGEKYNPYQDPQGAPWSSILFYSNNLINPSGNGYIGLYNGTAGTGSFAVHDKGYIDEYSINFGGNVSNTVYWGIGIGITDIDYKSEVYYSEDFNSANVRDGMSNGTVTGSGGYGLTSWKHIYGTGVNLKAGVIVKPVNELRLGFAVHTPTWYNLQQEGVSSLDYQLSTDYPIRDEYGNIKDPDLQLTDDGYLDYFEWSSRAPWRLIASAAGVIGGRFIVSGDYEYRPYQSVNVKDNNGNEYKDMTQDVKDYYKASNIVRLGAEFRVTPSFSVRAGYSYESSPVTDKMNNNQLQVYTSGPDDTEVTPSYSIDNSTQYITCGLGYRYKGFYVDAAYVHKYRKSTFHGYTPVDGYGQNTNAPIADVTDNNNSIVVSVGFKF